MKPSASKRIFSTVLTLCMLLSLIPVFHCVEAKAVSYDSLTCSDFISNETARRYIDVMMRYYLDNNSKLRSTLDDGLSVIFMFEGGSDNYREYGSTYCDDVDDIRNQSVVIVVQKNSSGNAYVDFWAENCSSIPGDPAWCSGQAYSGSTTILDGIYPFYTTNHTGPYAALQLDMSATNGYGYYTPTWDPDGFKNGASGINIHTRSTNIAGGAAKGWAWSEGCQVISSGFTRSDNYFNEFMQSVTGITWEPWVDYPNRNLNSFSYTGTHMGYYVLDRQLGLTNPGGTEYGAGSLSELYTEYALEQITAYSANARANADFTQNYFERCSCHPSYCLIQPTHDSSINTLPCAAGTNGCITFEKADPNKLYTCTGVYYNHAGNYWWELISSSGEVGYMYGESALFSKVLPSDLALTGAKAPNGHVQGETFRLTGIVDTKRFKLCEVSVWICSGFDPNGTKVTSSSATTAGNSFSLTGSEIDENIAFEQLAPGKYTYVVQAKYKTLFTKDNKLYSYLYSHTLMSEYFVVVPTAVSQSSCSHSFVTATLNAAACTEKGSAVKYCQLCGKLTKETLPALGHNYSIQTTVPATCTTDGFSVSTCAVCGHEEEQTIAATGHRDTLIMTAPTCVRQTGYAYLCQNCSREEPINLTPYRSQWLESVPEGMDPKFFAVRNQYRTRDDSSSDWTEWKDGTPSGYADSEVQTRKLYRMKAMPYGDHSWSDGVCIHCGQHCDHSYVNHCCTVCGYREPDNDLYLFGWINGANYACEEDADHPGAYKFVDGKLVVTFTERSYVAVKTGDNRIWYMTDGYPGDDAISAVLYSTQITGERSNKLPVPKGRQITFTVIHNGDGTLTLRYVAAECEHQWLDSICQVCGEVCEHLIWTHGICGSCGLVCNHESWTEGICDHCELRCTHSFTDNLCAICGYEKPPKEYYLFGYINGADYGCESDYQTLGEYRFSGGTLVTVFQQDSYVAVKTGDNRDWYMLDRWLGTDITEATLYNTETGSYEKLFVPGGKIVTFVLNDNGDDTLTLTYTAEDCLHENHDTEGRCPICGTQVEHSWQQQITNATCTAAGIIIRTCNLCGKIQYKTLPAEGHQLESAITTPTCSIPGYTTHTCTVCGYSYTDSEVSPMGHKDVLLDTVSPGCTTVGINQYQCAVCGHRHTKEVPPTGHRYEPIVTAPTCKKEGFTTYVCVCGDSYIGGTIAPVDHHYQNGNCVYCGESNPNITVPTLTLKSPTLEFKDMITVNAFYTAENVQDVVEMGMITYSYKPTAPNVATAEHIIPGATFVESSGRYYSSSQGIHAKYLADTVYLAIYAKLSDGSYAYSKVAGYSAVQYANSQLKNSADTKLKQLVVAMLNYGAEAQLYFGHNTGSLANATLTVDQKALPAAYNSGMVGAVPSTSATKQGIFANNQGFASRKPAISFEGAFCINYFFTPKYTPDNGITLYYWNEADYNAAEVLTAANATGKFKLEGSGTGEYRGDITGIAAKELSGAVFVATVYKNGGTVWTSGVLGYSIGAYCSSQASKGGTIADLAKATAVYGYHAKAYFG